MTEISGHTEEAKEVIVLSKQAFNQMIRIIKTAPIARARLVRTAARGALNRLGIKADSSKVVAGIPKGHDHFNGMSVSAWFDKVKAEHKRAIRQVVAIDATATARMG